MIITIEKTKMSQSGKSIGCLYQDKWFACKDFSIQQAEGQQVDVEISTQTFPDGGSITWINKWLLVGQGEPGHVVSPPVSGSAGVLGQPTPQQGVTDKDLRITAQGIMKAGGFHCDTADEAFAIYKRILDHLRGKAEPEPQKQEFNDDIPF